MDAFGSANTKYILKTISGKTNYFEHCLDIISIEPILIPTHNAKFKTCKSVFKPTALYEKVEK